MSEAVVMPQLGESIAEGTIVKWLKQPGDTIKKDEDLLIISTDKVEAEIPAPADGVLLSIDVPEGETVDVGTVLGQVGASGAAAAAAPAAAAPAPAKVESAPAPAPAAAPASGGAAEAVVMPQLGESIAEGTIVKWLKQPGEAVKKDEDLLVISTDKVEAEIPSPADGTLLSIAVPEGETVDVGTVLGQVGASGARAAAAPAPKAAAPAPSAAAPAAAPVQRSSGSSAPTTRGSDKARFVSPLVRRIAADNGISTDLLDSIPGTGNNGRVTKKDLMFFIENGGASSAPAPAPVATPSSAPAAAGATVAFAGGERESIKPASTIRKAIMKNMVLSRQTSAHVTTFFEVDFTNIDKVRNEHKRSFKEQEGVGLTYTVFVAAAVAQVLKRHSYINAEIRGTDLVFKRDVHLGMAVSIDKPEPGLMVPVIKNADTMNMRGLARSISDLASRVRSKNIKPGELSGGTFTITNPGNYGAIIGTPIINQPQLAILGMGNIEKKAVVLSVDGSDVIAIRKRGVLCLSFDHRLIDGATADIFMADVKKTLEEWNIAP